MTGAGNRRWNNRWWFHVASNSHRKNSQKAHQASRNKQTLVVVALEEGHWLLVCLVAVPGDPQGICSRTATTLSTKIRDHFGWILTCGPQAERMYSMVGWTNRCRTRVHRRLLHSASNHSRHLKLVTLHEQQQPLYSVDLYNHGEFLLYEERARKPVFLGFTSSVGSVLLELKVCATHTQLQKHAFYM